MNGPARFKSALSPGLEGRLLAAGFQQQPEPDSLKRAAERLGLPPGLLATSAAAVVVSAASSTTAAAAGKLSAFGGLGLVGATKAAIIGVSIGVGVAVGSTVLSVSHKPSPVNARPSSAQSVSEQATPGASATTTAAAAAAALPLALTETATATQRPGSSPSAPELVAATPAIAPSGAPVVGRFDDVAAEPESVSRHEPALPVAAPDLQLPNAAASGSAAIDPRLAREVASLDRARGFSLKGEAAAALGELDDFTRQFGYSALPLEAQFVRIDALVALGRRAEAARLAQSLPWENLSTAQRRRLQGIVRSR